MATHSSILAWRILWTEELGWLWSIALKSCTLKWLSMHIHADLLNAGLSQTFSFLKNAIYSKMTHVMWKSLSCARLFSIPWSVGCQAPLSVEFSRQEYWSGLLFSSPGDLPKPGIKPRSPALQADLPSEPPEKPPNEACLYWTCKRE